MTESAAKAAVTETTKTFLTRTETVWGKAFDSIIEKFKDGVGYYLEREQERFLWTKTFLHRDKVYFYDIYFPLRIEYLRKASQWDDSI